MVRNGPEILFGGFTSAWRLWREKQELFWSKYVRNGPEILLVNSPMLGKRETRACYDQKKVRNGLEI